jgi:hypothetical protein
MGYQTDFLRFVTNLESNFLTVKIKMNSKEHLRTLKNGQRTLEDAQ